MLGIETISECVTMKPWTVRWKRPTYLHTDEFNYNFWQRINLYNY